MSLLSAIAVLFVLVVIGSLSMRFRTKTSNALLLGIIAVLLLALISLSRLAMSLFGTAVALAILFILFAVFSLRRS